MGGKRLDKGQEATLQALVELGNTPTSVAKRMGISHHTAIAHVRAGYDDPEVTELIEIIKKAELSELLTITWKSRTILNKYLDDILVGDKKFNVISIIAAMDRSFQQARLIMDQPTAILNADHLVLAINQLKEDTKSDRKKLLVLKKKDVS